MDETILSLAQTITNATDEELTLLGMLCTAAQREWSDRLRQGVVISDCEELFICACAYSAAAGLLATRKGRQEPVSFTAGGLSIRELGETERTATGVSLRQAAERLMAPWINESDFAFHGVRA